MNSRERSEITVKAESTFYAALLECPTKVLSETVGLVEERKGANTFLRISKEILDPTSLFCRYLSHQTCRQIFGRIHPLYSGSTLRYDNVGKPIGINYFNTRLLLAFIEVQLGLGFSGSFYQQHQRAIEGILAGKPVKFETNYYHPFTHKDNVGIHYILEPNGDRGGYRSEDWENFLKYSKSAIECVFSISPEDFGNTPSGLERAIGQFTNLITAPYERESRVNMFPLRHWGGLIEGILKKKNQEGTNLIPHPVSGERIPYVHFVDCILDMPYQNGAVVVFQSMCGDR